MFISFHICIIEHNFGQNYLLGIAFSNTSVINTTILQNNAVNGDFLSIGDGNITEFQGLNVRQNRGNFKLLRSKTDFSDKIIYFDNNGSIIALNSLINFYGDNLFLRCRHILPTENGGVVTSERSTLHFYGTIYFVRNYSPINGGALFARNGKVYIHHKLIIVNNVARISGGGMYLYQSEFYCHFNCSFFQNYAVEMGGGIHAVSSKIIANNVELITENQKRHILFSENRARLGGAVNLEQNSKFSLVCMETKHTGRYTATTQ